MTHYPYENLTDEEFERLVIDVCSHILGIGCKTFSLGKDGAKDSWFEGTASLYPSKGAPWKGTFNIQAKHTKVVNASCSDNDFSVNNSSIIDKEIKRLKETQKSTPFDNYILFTNRKLSGMAHSNIKNKLSNGLGIKNVEIIGREDLDKYLDDMPQIAYRLGLSRFQVPLRFNDKDLRDIIVEFYTHRKPIDSSIKKSITDFSVIDKTQKNILNSLNEEYFEFMKSNSLQYFSEIEQFLQNPINSLYTEYYENTISDLKAGIIMSSDKFNDFSQGV